MKNFFFAFVLIAILGLNAQEKYLIFFKDKGFNNSSNSELIKLKYESARKLLTKRCLERRAKRGKNNLIDEYDIPIEEKYLTILKRKKIKIVHKLNWFNAVSAYLTPEEVKEISELPFISGIRKVKVFKFGKDEKEKLQKIKPSGFPLKSGEHRLNYGLSLNQLEMSDIPYLHDLNITGKGVLIGLMDTGFRWKEFDIFDSIKVIAEHDFVFNDDVTENQAGDDYNQDEHGTEILSILASYSQGNLIGSAFGAEFALAKTEDIRSETHVEEDNYAAALEWFENLGVDVTSSSLGYNIFDQGTYSYSYSDMNGKTAIVTRAAEIAFQKGLLTVTAAGNEARQPWHHIIAPADGFNTIAVGALRLDGSVASFSSRGPTADGRIKPDVCALGESVHVVNIYSGGFSLVQGTSASTPIVSGGAALILSAFPYIDNVQLRKIILESGSTANNPNNNIGYGKFSTLKALNYPNVRISNDSVLIGKYFYFPSDSLTDKPSMFLLTDTDSLKVPVFKSKGKFFTFLLPADLTGDSIRFYFNYSLADGKVYKDPGKDYYKYFYGDDYISHLTKNVIYTYLPDKFFVSNNYPNPFNGETKIQIRLPRKTKMEISVFDLLGRKVKKISGGNYPAGYYSEEINLNGFASGIYFLAVRTDFGTKVLKLILIK